MAGIYIHVPFCKQACTYCNFYFSTSPANKETFLGALLKEIDLSRDYLEGEKVETLYLGGGTPSLLSVEELKSILDKLSNHYDLTPLKEFTLEANPDDLTETKMAELRDLRKSGLNRLSIGVQSFSQPDLIYMNRAHNAEEALTSIKRVQDAGFENITVDLIYGTPGLTDEQWLKNLAALFELQVPHISAYALTVESKTALARNISTGKSKPVDEAQSAMQFKLLVDEMQVNGYEQYEISNFARPGRYAIHNSNYWEGKNYLGLGPSAHSFNQVSRRWNVSNNVQYIRSINGGTLPYEEEILTPEQKVNEKIMTGLRTQWGLDLKKIEANFANKIEQNLRHVENTHYIYTDRMLKLTGEGKLFADRIAANLFV